MTKEEYITYTDEIADRLVKDYGTYLYFLAAEVLSVGYLEKLVEKKGYTCERKTYGKHSLSIYSTISINGKEVGRISNQGAPEIMFYKRCRKYCHDFIDMDEVIEPIKGVHRVLDWHTVQKKKMHCLAGGETVLHFMPYNISDEVMAKFITETGLHELIEWSKSIDLKDTL